MNTVLYLIPFLAPVLRTSVVYLENRRQSTNISSLVGPTLRATLGLDGSWSLPSLAQIMTFSLGPLRNTIGWWIAGSTFPHVWGGLKAAIGMWSESRRIAGLNAHLMKETANNVEVEPKSIYGPVAVYGRGPKGIVVQGARGGKRKNAPPPPAAPKMLARVLTHDGIRFTWCHPLSDDDILDPYPTLLCDLQAWRVCFEAVRNYAAHPSWYEYTVRTWSSAYRYAIATPDNRGNIRPNTMPWLANVDYRTHNGIMAVYNQLEIIAHRTNEPCLCVLLGIPVLDLAAGCEARAVGCTCLAGVRWRLRQAMLKVIATTPCDLTQSEISTGQFIGRRLLDNEYGWLDEYGEGLRSYIDSLLWALPTEHEMRIRNRTIVHGSLSVNSFRQGRN